ncbi:MAG: type II toxin-antitoxin system RelE/ParE family toxin [Sphingorhabdus sp.]
MRIEFADERLLLLFTRDAHKLGLPIAVIRAAQLKLYEMEQAPDERSLRNWKGLRYKKLGGDREGQRSIRVNDQYRIVFEILNDEGPPLIRVLEIDDIH